MKHQPTQFADAPRRTASPARCTPAGRSVARAAALALSGLVAAITWSSGTAWAQMSQAAGQISVRGPEFLKDGRAWRAKGVNVGSFDTPARVRTGNAATVRAAYGAALLDKARTLFGADTIRFSVNERGLDPQSPIYDPTYAGEIAAGVALARSAGFTAIVVGDTVWAPHMPRMPDSSTVRAWQALAPHFAKDRGVLFELFNEPDDHGWGAAAWRAWQEAHQAIIAAIRALGARNVILVDGLWYGRITGGAPPLYDPVNQIGFGVHPYLFQGYDSVADWSRAFGQAASRVATIATEWNGTPKKSPCVADMPEKEPILLNYLHTLDRGGIGLSGWSLTAPDTLVKNPLTGDWRPTNYTHFVACGDDSGSGAGELFRVWRP